MYIHIHIYIFMYLYISCLYLFIFVVLCFFDFVYITIWDKVPTPLICDRRWWFLTTRYRCYLPQTTKKFMVKGSNSAANGCDSKLLQTWRLPKMVFFFPKSSQFEYWNPWWLEDPPLKALPVFILHIPIPTICELSIWTGGTNAKQKVVWLIPQNPWSIGLRNWPQQSKNMLCVIFKTCLNKFRSKIVSSWFINLHPCPRSVWRNFLDLFDKKSPSQRGRLLGQANSPGGRSHLSLRQSQVTRREGEKLETWKCEVNTKIYIYI